MNKKIIWGIVIVVILIGAGALYKAQKYPYFDEKGLYDKTIPTSDWKTYTDSINGYQISYPENWMSEKNPGVSIDLFNSAVKDKIKSGISGDMPYDLVRIIKNNCNANIINNKWKENIDGPGPTTWIKNECINKYSIIMYANNNSSELIEDQILSTFKFTSPQPVSAVSTSNWETYTNTKYGFSLKLPPSWKGYRVQDYGQYFSFGIKDQDQVFSVIVFNQKSWDEELQAELRPFIYLGGNNNYIFAMSRTQDYSDQVLNLITQNSDFDNIKLTFQLI